MQQARALLTPPASHFWFPPSRAAPPAGLAQLRLEAAAACVVFEEANHAPLELELSHLARLLSGAAGAGGGQVALSVCVDAAVGQRRQCLTLDLA